MKIEDMLDTVSEEIQELRTDFDKLNSEYHVSEKLKLLGEDLDKATSMINSELQIVSSKISTEFLQLISNLATELDQITIKVSGTSKNVGNGKVKLTEAVSSAGIGIK